MTIKKIATSFFDPKIDLKRRNQFRELVKIEDKNCNQD